MTVNLIDLYSDTVSRPSPGMRQAIAEAEVGNEQAGEDPSTNRLQDMVAALLGKEAALLLPSGTMCNQIAYRTVCEPGDEIILDKTAHPLHYEAGGPAALSGAMTRALDGTRGIFGADQVRAAIRVRGGHYPISKVLSIENTSNGGGGSIWPLDRIGEVAEVAHAHGLSTHMDGARLLNAVVATGVSAADYARHFDSLWICLSKGLGCPIGGVLAGTRDFIDRAWRFKHQFGGAMRQSGMMAAAGIYALENNVDRLADDHANARHLAALLADIPGIVVEPVETNMVFFDVAGAGKTAAGVADALLSRGVRIGANAETRMRAVAHLDVDRAGIDAAAAALREVVT